MPKEEEVCRKGGLEEASSIAKERERQRRAETTFEVLRGVHGKIPER